MKSVYFLCWLLIFGANESFGGGFVDSIIWQDDILYGLAADTGKQQVPEPNKPWIFGVTAGFLFSTVEGDLTENHSYVIDFSAGMYARRDIFYPLGLMAELYYAGLGTGFVTVSDSKLNFNYLVLPVMFTYEFLPGFSVGVGPYFGFLLSATDKGDDFKEDITELVNWLDVGAKVAFYYELNHFIGLGAGFTRGFINTQRGERVSQLKQYNQSVMFSATFNMSSILNEN